MDLLKDIKQKRAENRRKKPIKRNVFNQTCTVVKQFGLKGSFLDVLDKVEEYLTDEKLRFSRVRLKTPLETPLFSLANEDEYALTMSIIDKVGNSYLEFAHSPEEILLCGPLYRLNATLDPDKLIRYHFETLFLHENAKL
jgi:hypothetical protein